MLNQAVWIHVVCVSGAAGDAGQTSLSERGVAPSESGGERPREEGALQTPGQ